MSGELPLDNLTLETKVGDKENEKDTDLTNSSGEEVLKDKVSGDSNTKVSTTSNDVDDEDDQDEENPSSSTTSAKKKKNKKKKKKGSGHGIRGCHNGNSTLTGTKPSPSLGVYINSEGNGFTDSYIKYGQTEPPTIPVEKLFQKGFFPEGEIMEHPLDINKYRMTSEEKRAEERMLNEDLYDKVRMASECHRQVRKYAQSFIEPGIKLIDMCERL